MNNFKKVGLTALAGSLAAVSAHAAEMSVSGATLLTYTSEDGSETDGNPFGMKTNLSFTASGDVNGMTVSYMQVSKDKFAGMSSARLSIDMGDLGTLAFDQGSGSGLATIDDKTPTAAEEIWDGLDNADSSAGVAGLVGAAGNTGVFNYIKSMAGVTFNGAMRRGSGTANSDGGSSGTGGSAWDFALTGSGDMLGVDGLAWGAGYGVVDNGEGANNVNGVKDDDDEHLTAYINYSFGPVTVGVQQSEMTFGAAGTASEQVDAFGIALNVNEDLSISYGEREVEFGNDSAAHVTEDTEGLAIAYTMGSMKIAGNRNEIVNSQGATGASAKDEMTEIAVSFAF